MSRDVRSHLHLSLLAQEQSESSPTRSAGSPSAAAGSLQSLSSRPKILQHLLGSIVLFELKSHMYSGKFGIDPHRVISYSDSA